MDSKARECILVGYRLDDSGYKLYDPREQKVVLSRDVVFMEDQTIEDIRAQTAVTPSQLEDEVFHDANSDWKCEESAQGAQLAEADEGEGARPEPRAQPLRDHEGSHDCHTGMYLTCSP